jgi:hypothetical protein
MGVELRPNDNAREGRASVWIFSGRSIAYLVVGVGMGIALFRQANMVWGFDVLSSLIIGTMPLAAITLFVQVLVNGKPPSHAWDVMCWGLWRVHAWAYRSGIVDRPPQFWVSAKKPRHPRTFMGDKG